MDASAGVSDPAGRGIVASPAHPGGKLPRIGGERDMAVAGIS